MFRAGWTHGMARPLQALAVCVLGLFMLGAGDASEGRFQRVGHNLMCPCGCAEVLLECNHVGCPDSAGMISELRSHLSNGGSDGAILRWFTQKYGATVLAAPLRGGFDIIAWVMPMAVLVLAIVGTGVLVSVWKRRLRVGALAGGDAGPLLVNDAVRQRIRRETEY